MGKSVSPPPTPDYTAAAKEQGRQNLISGQQSAVLSNPNMYTPFGTQTVSYSKPTFDQTRYDADVAAYNKKIAGVDKNAFYNQGGGGDAGGSAPGKWVQGNDQTGMPISYWQPDESSFDKTGYETAIKKFGAAPDRNEYMTGGGIPTVTQTLTPQAQQTLESQQRVQTALANLGETGIANARATLEKPFVPTTTQIEHDFGGYGDVPNAANYMAKTTVPLQYSIDTSGAAAMPINAGTTAQELILKRLNPTIEAGDVSFRQQLANQGLVPGTEAYDKAFRNREMSKNDLYSQAALQGINLDMAARNQTINELLGLGTFGNQAQLAGAGLYNAAMGQNYGQGMQTQGTEYSQALNKAQFQNTAQQQQLAQDLALRAQPINEVIGLMGGSQIQLPQFAGYQGTSIAPAPTFAGVQAANQAAMQNYGIQQAGQNATTQGLSSAALAAAMYF